MKFIHMQGQFWSFWDIRLYQENYIFRKTHNATWCHNGDICIWNKFEYLAKEESFYNSIEKVTELF